MTVGFSTIPEEAKIWVFPSNRKFYPQEIEEISKSVETFLNNWKSDRDPIECSFLIKHDRFIIITANDTEYNLSLEAQDTLTSFIIELEKKYEVVLLDKINVCYKQGEFVQYKDLKEFKKMMKKDLMAKTNLTSTTLAKMSKDFPVSMDVLGRICKALNVNIGDIVDYVDDDTSN